MRRRPLRLAALTVLAVVALAGSAPAHAQEDPEPGKVLVVSAPSLRWADLVTHDLPRLEAFLSDARVAMLSLRTIGARTSLGEGYATISAGNRAAAGTAEAGLALERRERFETGTAAQAYERRTLLEATGDLVHLGYPSIARTNNRYLYGAEPGALAATLAEAGRRIGVVANGDLGLVLPPATLPPEPEAPVDETTDEDEPDPDEPVDEEPVEPEEPVDSEDEDLAPVLRALADSDHGRSAALAGVDFTGQVEVGVADGLLQRDPEAAYGVRYDIDRVVEGFEQVFEEVDVAVVELSDLDRADGYRTEATSEAARQLWADALARSDELFGRLVDAVPADTRVLVVAPSPPRSAETLGVFALSGDGPGLARSATTRRPGYVTLPDIAPTILDHFDIDRPTSMTGTPIVAAEGGTVDEARFGDLAATTNEAVFRDEATGPISVVFVIAQILAYALAAFAVGRRRRWTRPVSFLALVILATPPVGFLAGLLHLEHGSVVTYAIGIFAAAAVLAAAAEGIGSLVARRWPRTRATLAPLVLVALTWTVLVVDVLTGGELQINTVFGYSPRVAGRFAGFGNLAFALVGVGAVVVACGAWATFRLARERVDGSARLRGGPAAAVIAFLALTVVIDGAPMWGSDVGGVLATVPAFTVLVLVAMGVRVDLKRAALIGVATLVALAAFATVDLSRPEDERTHLGRLVARVADDDGGGGFLEVIQRKLGTNLSILTSSVWTLTIPFALGLLVFLARRRQGFLRDMQEEVPGIRPMLAGGLLVAFLGFALNDSGVAVPAMMFAVLLPYLTYVLLRWDPAPR